MTDRPLRVRQKTFRGLFMARSLKRKTGGKFPDFCNFFLSLRRNMNESYHRPARLPDIINSLHTTKSRFLNKTSRILLSNGIMEEEGKIRRKDLKYQYYDAH